MTIRTLLATVLAASVLVVSPSEAAPPATYTAPAVIPGTEGEFNHLSSTAPDGTDVVILQKPGSLTDIHALVRLPGRTTWKEVPPRVKDKFNVQDIVIAPIGAHDFQLAWTEYAPGFGPPEVYSMRLNTRTRTWTAPQQVFKTDAVYAHAGASIGVAKDGTVVIAAYAPTKESMSPPRYRAIVAVRYPGASTFKQKYLSPVDEHTGAFPVSVSPNGHVVVPMIVGYNLAEMTVYAATKEPGAGSPWRIKALSVAGDAQKVAASVNDQGVVGVAWPAPSSAPWTTIRVAHATMGTANPIWTTQDAATGVSFAEPDVVVTRSGTIITVYGRSSAGVLQLEARPLNGTTFGTATPFTPADRSASVGSVVLRPDGRVGVLYGLYTFGPTTPHGIFLTTISATGVPGTALPLTPVVPDSQNQYVLSVDAASRGNVVFARGFPPPDTDLEWMGQGFAPPDVMTSATSGRYVRRAKVQPLRGDHFRCTSGFWVEKASLDFRWYRNGHRIRGAVKAKYHAGPADQGKRLSCKVIASNSGGKRVLSSRARRV